jgi:hypothetical protein
MASIKAERFGDYDDGGYGALLDLGSRQQDDGWSTQPQPAPAPSPTPSWTTHAEPVGNQGYVPPVYQAPNETPLQQQVRQASTPQYAAAQPAPAPTPLYQAVADMYVSALGRQGNDAEIQRWIQDTGGDVRKVQAGIWGSPEAAAWAQRAQGTSVNDPPRNTSPGGPVNGDYRSWFLGLTNGKAPTPAQLKAMEPLLNQYGIALAPNAAGVNGKIRLPDGRIIDVIQAADRGGVAWQWLEGGGAPAYSAGPDHGYTDPNSQFFLNEVMNRINQLRPPVEDPFENFLKLMALQRVQGLDGDPFTAGEDAALTAKYRDPLTQARDQAKKQKALELARRGFDPNSPLYQGEMTKIDQAYQGGIAQGANDLGVRAVDEKNRRGQEQLSILANLLQVNRTGADRQNDRYDQIVQLAKVFPDFDAQRLDQLLRASDSGTNPASAMSALTSLGGLNLSAQRDANANSQDSAAAWGQILGYIMGQL